MSMTDPISDMLTRIRNGQGAGKAEVSLQSSRVKLAILRVDDEQKPVKQYQRALSDRLQVGAVDGRWRRRIMTMYCRDEAWIEIVKH